MAVSEPGRSATCPSGRCREGAQLLGIVGRDGVLGYVSPPLAVDAEFVFRARSGRPPESRFRFSEPCAENGCAQWDDNRCGLIDKLVAAPAATPEARLPDCGIRRSCRWFAQRKGDACAICPLVVHTRRTPLAPDED